MSDFIIHRIQGYISRVHLIEYDDRMLLIDSGSRSDVSRIEQYCAKKLMRPMSDISLCLVTHIHPDHAGGAKLLRKKYGIKLAAHKDIDLWYKGITGSIQHYFDTFMAHSMRTLKGRQPHRAWYSSTLRPDYSLEDGDPLPGFEGWQAIHVPGHTLHDLALFHQGMRILYTADAIIKEKDKWLPPIPVLFKNQMRRSYLKMKNLKPARIITAHGDEIEKEDILHIFETMIETLERPLNSMGRAAFSVSLFPPQVWKSRIAGMRDRRKEKRNHDDRNKTDGKE